MKKKRSTRNVAEKGKEGEERQNGEVGGQVKGSRMRKTSGKNEEKEMKYKECGREGVEEEEHYKIDKMRKEKKERRKRTCKLYGSYDVILTVVTKKSGFGMWECVCVC
jgi:hypothetical protein